VKRDRRRHERDPGDVERRGHLPQHDDPDQRRDRGEQRDEPADRRSP
jgi:hypothetical protein